MLKFGSKIFYVIAYSAVCGMILGIFRFWFSLF